MDSDAGKPNICKSNHPSLVVERGDGGREAAAAAAEEESNSLLGSGGGGRGRAAVKRQKSSKRRVKWNDHHGNKLVQILEFQPSDSDSDEDEYLDSCMCTVM